MEMKINAEYRPVIVNAGLRKTWHSVLAGKFADSPFDALLFYDRTDGTSEFYSTLGDGNIALLGTNSGWDRTWDQIVPGYFGGSRFAGLLFYDRDAGLGEFYSTDGQGNLTLLGSHTGWRTSWHSIVPVELSYAYMPLLLLFYDRGAGHGEFYS